MPRRLPTPARLEAFSDGVIAVIITIMVLELKVPHLDGLAGLRTIGPTLAVYLLSFTFTGVYWVNHGHLVDRLRHADAVVLWANLAFLFFLSLLPFFTDYLAAKHRDPFSVELYSASLLCTAFGFQALSAAILRHVRHNDTPGLDTPGPHVPGIEAESDRADHVLEIWKGWISVACYGVSWGLAHWHPELALGTLACVTLLWIVPGVQIRPQRPSEHLA